MRVDREVIVIADSWADIDACFSQNSSLKKDYLQQKKITQTMGFVVVNTDDGIINFWLKKYQSLPGILLKKTQTDSSLPVVFLVDNPNNRETNNAELKRLSADSSKLNAIFLNKDLKIDDLADKLAEAVPQHGVGKYADVLTKGKCSPLLWQRVESAKVKTIFEETDKNNNFISGHPSHNKL